MMMRFTKITEDMQEALMQFCFEQETMNRYANEEEIESVIESAFAVMNKIPDASLPIAPIYRYHMYAGEQFTDEILPYSIRENGVLYEEMIHLGTFMLDSYSANTEEAKGIVRGYDVIYDIESQEIKLLYRIMTTDDSVTTLYRVDTDLYEDFEACEFVIDLTSQIISRLEQSLSIPLTLTMNIKEAV